MSYKIGVIGDKSSVMPFKVMGFQVAYTEEVTNIPQLVDEWAQDGFGVIYMTDILVAKHQDEISKYNELMVPAIIPIPSYRGSSGYGVSKISEYVEKAVGQNIL